MTVRRLAVLPLVALGLLTACSADDSTDTSAESSAAPSSTALVEPKPIEPPASPSGDWPDEAPAAHGEPTWGVYLAVGDVTDPTVQEAYDHAISLGYAGAGIGQLGCDEGAAEALGADQADMRVAVYFDSREKAEEFVAMYDQPTVGVVEVTTYCLD